MEVYVDNRQKNIEINEDVNLLLKKIVKEVLTLEGISMDSEVSISFVDSKEIKHLNKNYRGVDETTDVLSFPMEDEFHIGGIKILGDIIICTQKAVEQSKEFEHTLEREIAYLTTHSMLHLLGYDHILEEEKNIMREKEKQIMKRIKIFKNIKGE